MKLNLPINFSNLRLINFKETTYIWFCFKDEQSSNLNYQTYSVKFPCCGITSNQKTYSSDQSNDEIQSKSEPINSYRSAQRDECKLVKDCITKYHDLNKAYGRGLFHLDPKSWQTGLDRCEDMEAYQWKKVSLF